MIRQTNTHKAAACLALCGFFTAGNAHAEPGATPDVWLDRMSAAVQTTSYQGTVIRFRDGRDETFKVVHTVSDGVVREKVIKQDGDGLEIIRNGSEVLCIFPDREFVLVEEWNNQSTLFSTLPSSGIHSGGDYDVLIKGFDRVAGRKAVKLAVLPHDEFRYGHQLWLDDETGFPLKARLLDTENGTLQLVKFADIQITSEFLPDDLLSSYVTTNWKWTDVSRQRQQREIETDWVGQDVPRGFSVISTPQEILPGTDEQVTHILYSDGLAIVSVFISAGATEMHSKRSRLGASNSYSTVIDGYRVTAVGEVPEVTVEQIARSMQRQK